MLVKVWLLVVASLALLGVGCDRVENRKISDNRDSLSVLELELVDYAGRQVRLSDLTDKPLVINAWATWCPFCVDELPDFSQVAVEYSDRARIIIVNREEELEDVQAFLQNIELSQEVIQLLDSQDNFYKSIGGFSMPETIFVRADGSLQFHKRGPMAIDEMRQRIDELVKDV